MHTSGLSSSPVLCFTLFILGILAPIAMAAHLPRLPNRAHTLHSWIYLLILIRPPTISQLRVSLKYIFQPSRTLKWLQKSASNRSRYSETSHSA